MADLITFQAQIDDERNYTKEELLEMEANFNIFCFTLEKFGYIRVQMYKNNKTICPIDGIYE